MTFHIEGAAYPNYVGTDQRRFFKIEGDRLTLRTPPERAGDNVWRRHKVGEFLSDANILALQVV